MEVKVLREGVSFLLPSVFQGSNSGLLRLCGRCQHLKFLIKQIFKKYLTLTVSDLRRSSLDGCSVGTQPLITIV